MLSNVLRLEPMHKIFSEKTALIISSCSKVDQKLWRFRKKWILLFQNGWVIFCYMNQCSIVYCLQETNILKIMGCYSLIKHKCLLRLARMLFTKVKRSTFGIRLKTLTILRSEIQLATYLRLESQKILKLQGLHVVLQILICRPSLQKNQIL